MKGEFLTASNLLSIARALLVVPFALVMLVPDAPLRPWGAALLALAALTDKLDGVLARKFGQETEWGRILDPLADKVGIAVVALVMLGLRDLPVWFVAALIVRDLLIFAGGIYVRQKRGVVLPSNNVGKWAFGIIGGTLFLRLLGVLPELTGWLLYGCAAMLLVSFLLYGGRFVKTMKSPSGEAAHGTP
jgi:CDP-diacylglycerol--glycerol-3-phosphate 3-phosphatidyltransferase